MQRLRARLSHFLPDISVVRSPSFRPYVALITFSAVSLAIGFGIFLRNHLTFTWHDTTGVIGWVSVHQYPKQQEFFYYLLALIGIPAVICLYWFGWQVYSRWAAQLTAQPLCHVLKANALASMPLWFCWLQLPNIDKAGLTGLFLPIGFSLFIKVGLLYNRFLPSLQHATDPSEPNTDSDVYPVSDSVGIVGETGGARLLHVINGCVAFVLIPVFIYLLMYSGDVDGQLDLFHEGERLAPLNEMLRGGIPFRDIYVQHGLFQNAYLAGVGSWIFEPTLMGVRSMERVLSPLGYVALYLLGLQVFRVRWFTAFICVLIASGTDFSVSARHSLGLLSFAIVANFLTHFYRRALPGLMQGFFCRRTLPFSMRLWHWTRHSLTFGWQLILAGICTSLAFWYSTEVGLYSLGGIGLFLLLFSLQGGMPMSLRPLPLTTYACGILLGFLPVSLYFLWHGALDDMFWNTYIQCRYQIATWGLAFPSLSDTLTVLTKEGWQAFILSEGFQWYLPIGVFVGVAVHLTYRCLRGELWNSEGATKLLLLLLGGIAFFRTALGRADGGHLHYGSTFLWLLCLLPLERGLLAMMRSLVANLSRVVDRRFRMNGRRAETYLKTAWILIPIMLFCWYVGEVHQPLAGFEEKWQRLRQNPFSRRVALEELARAGRVDIPDEQAAQIQQVVAYIHEHTAPNEKIFDFTSQGAYYFFANRPSVTRFHQVSYASTPAMQREVVSALERDGTRLVLFKTGGWFDAVDGIPVEERHPIIAKYLQENYTLAVDINGTQILWRQLR